MSVVIVLGILAVVVSLWDKFGTPRYRPYRALVFIVFGLSGIAPATHYAVQNGWERSITEASLGWLVFMGFLYITGALFYAFRIPERFFPGKVDIWVGTYKLSLNNIFISHFFLVSQPSNFPLLCYCWCIRSLPRNFFDGFVQITKR